MPVAVTLIGPVTEIALINENGPFFSEKEKMYQKNPFVETLESNVAFKTVANEADGVVSSHYRNLINL